MTIFCVVAIERQKNYQIEYLCLPILTKNYTHFYRKQDKKYRCNIFEQFFSVHLTAYFLNINTTIYLIQS